MGGSLLRNNGKTWDPTPCLRRNCNGAGSSNQNLADRTDSSSLLFDQSTDCSLPGDSTDYCDTALVTSNLSNSKFLPESIPDGHNIIMTTDIQYEGGAGLMIYFGTIYYDRNNINICDERDFMMESVRHHLTEAGILITTPASHTPV